MDRHPHRLAGLSDFQMSADGKMFAFKIVTKDGITTDIEIEASELGTLVQYLVANAGQMAQAAFNDGVSLPPLGGHAFSPIPVRGIGMASAASHADSLLVTHLFGFDLAFEIPNSELHELADAIARTATLMSSDHKKPQ